MSSNSSNSDPDDEPADGPDDSPGFRVEPDLPPELAAAMLAVADDRTALKRLRDLAAGPEELAAATLGHDPAQPAAAE